MTLQAILDCAEDSFSRYNENRNVWIFPKGKWRVATQL